MHWISIVAKAEGEASRFLQTLKEYEKAPEVTRKRLYLDTMEQVLANTSKVVMQIKEGNSLMYIPLDKLMENRGRMLQTPEEDEQIGVPSSNGSAAESRLRNSRSEGGR
jgi:membrane protease subunit HflK